jgi:arylsulfatase B
MKTLSISLMSIFLLVLFFSACYEEIDDPAPSDTLPNILLIIADDLGKDAINGFTEGSTKPRTPNIDAIRNSGITFNNLWVYPTCTPTRASIITGKYGYNTQVKAVGDVLSSSELSLQKYIGDNTDHAYATALVGKWHLSGNNTSFNPESFGIDYYAGLIRGSLDDYYQWQLSEDGTTRLQTEYSTEVFTDLSIQWVNEQSKPWFLWLAYNAPHTPFHVPPNNMHSQGSLAEYTIGADPIPYYMAAIEAMDFQIGKLLDSIPGEALDNTIIFFIGDNGTPNQVAQSPYTSTTVKNTLYQGGINTPMFVSGAGVARSGTDESLVTSSDLFATIAEIAGLSISQIHDSKSFKSLLTQPSTIRDFQYAEKKDGTDESWTIRNKRYKLIINPNGEDQMFDLDTDAYEKVNLLDGDLSTDELDAKSELEDELKSIRN